MKIVYFLQLLHVCIKLQGMQLRFWHNTCIVIENSDVLENKTSDFNWLMFGYIFRKDNNSITLILWYYYVAA